MEHQQQVEMMRIKSEIESGKWEKLFSSIFGSGTVAKALDRLGDALGEMLAGAMRGGVGGQKGA